MNEHNGIAASFCQTSLDDPKYPIKGRGKQHHVVSETHERNSVSK